MKYTPAPSAKPSCRPGISILEGSPKAGAVFKPDKSVHRASTEKMALWRIRSWGSPKIQFVLKMTKFRHE